MHRIDTPTKAADLFGPGKHGWKDGNRAQGISATDASAAAFNDLWENICRFIESRGIPLVKGDYEQLTAAINDAIIGAQKAVTISNAVFEASVADGEVVRWDAGNNRFDEAIADGTANNRAVGIADVTNSKVYLYGECPLFVGLTPGARYYLDGATPGSLAAAAPADGIIIGIAKSATTLFVDIDVNDAGLNASNHITTSATVTLTASAFGASYQLGGAGQVVTMPLAASGKVGSRIALSNPSPTNSVTISAQGADKFEVGTAELTSLVLLPGDWIVFESAGAGYFYAVGGSAILKHVAGFGASIGANGYQKLPSGLIIQWGTHSAASWTSATVTFPITFPNGAYFHIAGEISDSAPKAVAPSPINASSFGLYVNGPASAYSVAWLVIGY